MLDLDSIERALSRAPLPIQIGVTVRTPENEAAVVELANAAPELIAIARAVREFGLAELADGEAAARWAEAEAMAPADYDCKHERHAAALASVRVCAAKGAIADIAHSLSTRPAEGG